MNWIIAIIIGFCVYDYATAPATVKTQMQSIGRQVMNDYETAAERAAQVKDATSACVNYSIAFEAALKDVPDHVSRLADKKKHWCQI